MSDRPKLQLPANYDVGYAKPPEANRFKPGVSGNPRGRPKGKTSKIPAMTEERFKDLLLAEAYRDVPIFDRGRKKRVSMIQANIRALALNGAKGNNRAANIFATNVQKVEAERKKFANEWFGSAIDYKQRWGAELKRRERLGLDLPPPIPHPDDFVLDARTGTVHVRGPKTREDLDRYEMGELIIELLYEVKMKLAAQVSADLSPQDRAKLEQRTKENSNSLKVMLRYYGPPEIRRSSQYLFDMEDEMDIDLTGWTKWEPEKESEGK